MKKIIVADGEASITTLIKYNLDREGYNVIIAHDGYEVVEAESSQKIDFIIVSLMLPKLDGLEVTKRIREKNKKTPILIVTAQKDVINKKVGFDIGVDDYLTKPFSPRELIARMKTVFNRVGSERKRTSEITEVERINIGDLTIYPSKFIVEKKDVELSLTKKEFELLVYFMERKGRVISRETLIQTIWNEELYSNSKTVDRHVSHIREKIEDNPKEPEYLKTVRGFGYRFQDPKGKNQPI